MIQASVPTTLNGSRLVRFLLDLSVADVEVSHKHFTERLGQLIGLSDSVALSRVHAGLAAVSGEQGTSASAAPASEAVIEAFMDTRRAAVQFIASTFDPQGGISWLSLPAITADTTQQEAAAFDGYQQFYINHQREMIFKLNKLRADTRAAVAARSPRLAQLVALDAALDVTLNVHIRTLFATVPRLLGKRFQALYQQHQEQQQARTGQPDDDPQLWLEPGGWLAQFTTEMQGLLLAELEVRLQPILGLIEALNEEDDTTS